MKAILLDGSHENDGTGNRVHTALTVHLQDQGWEVEDYTLCDRRIGNCAGDFFCFIRTPGVCNVNDDNRGIAEVLVNCQLMVYLTPVRFGGFSPTLKKMVDHQIQNISPFFSLVSGETHHAKRYRNNPDLLVVGWMDTPAPHSEKVFNHLVQRIALNWHSKTWVSGVILTDQTEEALQVMASRWLDDIQNHKSSPHVELPPRKDASLELNIGTKDQPFEIRRGLLLVGSPKTRKSTSNSLGGYLFEQLEGRAIQTKTIFPHTVLRSEVKMRGLLEAVDAADLITLAFPLYCDSLPAPVLETLERIADHRKEQLPSRRQLFSTIANCGFPEAYQCDTALAICEIFADQAGFEWAGGMALGGGGMVDGFPLAEGGGKTIRMRQSLDLAAEALAQGKAIPKEAREGLARPLVPHWTYWLISWNRWNQDAKRYGAKKFLKRKPYLANSKPY